MIDKSRREYPVKSSYAHTRPDPRGCCPQSADNLTRIASCHLAPCNRYLVRHHAFAGLRRIGQPPHAATDSIIVVWPACVGEVEKRHRGHRVLMDAVDRVALDNITRPRVVVPPPLARIALGCADTSCDGGRGLECLGVVRAPVQTCECLDGIDLVSEAPDMRAVWIAAAHDVGV